MQAMFNIKTAETRDEGEPARPPRERSGTMTIKDPLFVLFLILILVVYIIAVKEVVDKDVPPLPRCNLPNVSCGGWVK